MSVQWFPGSKLGRKLNSMSTSHGATSVGTTSSQNCLHLRIQLKMCAHSAMLERCCWLRIPKLNIHTKSTSLFGWFGWLGACIFYINMYFPIPSLNILHSIQIYASLLGIWLQIAKTMKQLDWSGNAEHSPTVLRTVCTHASLRYGSGFDEGDEDEDLWFAEGPCDTKKGSFWMYVMFTLLHFWDSLPLKIH